SSFTAGRRTSTLYETQGGLHEPQTPAELFMGCRNYPGTPGPLGMRRPLRICALSSLALLFASACGDNAGNDDDKAETGTDGVTGDGDGDSNPGDGDGDTTTGDGDGDTTTGD